MTANLPLDLDQAALLEITEAAGLEPGELISMFIDDTRENIRQLGLALKAGDRETAHRMSHSMKSSAANVGAMRLAIYSRTLEAATKSGLESGVEEMFTELCVALGDFETASADFLRKIR